MGLLDNKVAIVTGGAKGLGEAYCLRLAKEGAKVVVADILEKEAEEVVAEIKAAGGQAIAVKADVTSEESTVKMAEETVKAFGRIDVLVNNAVPRRGSCPPVALAAGPAAAPAHRARRDRFRS